MFKKNQLLMLLLLGTVAAPAFGMDIEVKGTETSNNQNQNNLNNNNKEDEVENDETSFFSNFTTWFFGFFNTEKKDEKTVAKVEKINELKIEEKKVETSPIVVVNNENKEVVNTQPASWNVTGMAIRSMFSLVGGFVSGITLGNKRFCGYNPELAICATTVTSLGCSCLKLPIAKPSKADVTFSLAAGFIGHGLSQIFRKPVTEEIKNVLKQTQVK